MAKRTFWERLEGAGKLSAWREYELTQKAVEEWNGWHLHATSGAVRWVAVGPGGKRLTASSSAELVRKVRAENDEDAARPVQCDLFAAPAPKADACEQVTEADLVPEDAPSVRVVGTHRQLGVEVRLGVAADGGRR